MLGCCAGLVLAFSGAGIGVPQATEKPKPMVQPVTKRIWKGEIKNKLFIIGTEKGKMVLFNPMSVKVDHKGNIYVNDFGDRKLKKFTSDGKLEREFGFGRGKGPGEFSIITDYEIRDDGSVWVCDPLNGLITVFDTNGNIRTTIRGNELPYRVVVLNDERFVIYSSPMVGDKLFSLYDKKGNLLRKFGMFVNNQSSRMGVVLDARFAKAPGEVFVVAFVRIGLFAVYQGDYDNPLVYQTINYAGIPEIVTITRGNTRTYMVDRKAPYASHAVSIVGDEIHLLSEIEEQPNKSIFDVYNLATGLYKHSYLLSTKANHASVTETRIYSVQDTTVTVWSR